MGSVFSEVYQCFVDAAAILDKSLPRCVFTNFNAKRTALSILSISVPKNLNT
jgi:hypothetical protein